MDRAERIRTYIIDNFLLGEESDLDGTASLLESGIVDSTGVMELAMFLEEAFGIRVADEDFVPENLDTIENLAGFVERKLAGHGRDIAGGGGSP